MLLQLGLWIAMLQLCLGQEMLYFTRFLEGIGQGMLYFIWFLEGLGQEIMYVFFKVLEGQDLVLDYPPGILTGYWSNPELAIAIAKASWDHEGGSLQNYGLLFSPCFWCWNWLFVKVWDCRPDPRIPK